MVYEFEVIGDIKGKARPRVNTYTAQAYTPTNTKDYEMLIKQYFKVKYPRYVPLENRVYVKNSLHAVFIDVLEGCQLMYGPVTYMKIQYKYAK